MGQRVFPYDYKLRPLEVDDTSGGLVVTDFSHHEIHEGDHFCVFINKDVANGGTYGLAWSTPNTTKWIHMLVNVQVEGESDVILYEGVTSWTGGGAVTPINNNRNSTTVSTITNMVTDPTMTLGTPVTIAHGVVPAGRNSGGGVRNDAEFILKQNTKYYLLVTNQVSGATNETNFALEWYEHTNKYA